MTTIRACVYVSVTFLVVACKGKESATGGGSPVGGSDQSWSPATLTAVQGVPEAQIETALKARLDAKPPAQIDRHKWSHTKRLYAMYNNKPLWLNSDGLHKQRAYALTNAVLNAEQDGLRLETYPITDLARTIAALKQTDHPTADQLADADVVLTSAFVSLGVDYLIGQTDPKSLSQSWHIDRHDENEDSALVRSIRNPALDKAIASMRPTDDDYVGLQKALGQLRSATAKGGWPTIPAGKSVKPGESDSPARLTALRARLAAEGISVPAANTASATSPTPADAKKTPATGGSIYDHALAAAVATWQSRHGIAVDSMLGPETLKALNVPAGYRLGQIAANLERFRWLPRSLGERYVYVNVPAFRLEAYDGGQKALEMKVIVGQEYEDKATPVFADSMEFVVFRPYWNVPPNIAEKEIFPKGEGYLASQNMETYSEGGETRVRQRPGPKNALGLVKFLFPNDFNIYFHDTPNDELFKKDVRAFSHGCIRLEHPDQMAQYVLGWPADKVHEAMESGPNDHQVKLPKKLPVYIVYGTAYIRDGQLYFGNDLYDRDGPLVQAVYSGAAPNPQVVQAVEALRRIAASA